jgi:lysozyme family protein
MVRKWLFKTRPCIFLLVLLIGFNMRKKIDFYTSVERALGHEGQYSNDPDDPGGETNWGISKRSYPSLDIRNLTREDAIAIYKRDYWETVEGVPDSVKFQLFDFAINSGIGNTIRALQRACDVVPDGKWGIFSKAAAETISESDLLMLVLAERLDFMRKTQAWKNGLASGLAGRVAQNLRFAAQDNEV